MPLNELFKLSKTFSFEVALIAISSVLELCGVVLKAAAYSSKVSGYPGWPALVSK